MPLGVLLSSGLNSRVVVTYAQEILGGTIQTFTVGFGADDSELTGAAETAREIRSHHHPLEINAQDFAASIGQIAHHLDEPIGDPACFAVFNICKFARQHVKVLLRDRPEVRTDLRVSVEPAKAASSAAAGGGKRAAQWRSTG